MTTSPPPEGSSGDADERRALEALAAAATAAAPQRLRRRIDAERVRAAPLARQRRRGFAAAVVVVVAALAASAVFILSPGASDATVLAEVAALHARSADKALPPPLSPTLLDLSAEGLPFPNFRSRGWRAGGTRTDTLRGRTATTVFYRKGSRRIGYTIVSGRPLTPPADASRLRRGALTLASFAVDGRTVVTWERGGLTAVLSGRRVVPDVLARLAAGTG
jgi:hypothetical protein